MKCTLNPNIKSISGKCGNMLFKTFKKRDGSTETRAYFLPKKDRGPFGYTYGYTRRGNPSAKEIEVRKRFSQVNESIKNLSDEQRSRYEEEWRISKYMFNGKKYVTLRGYIMARIYAEQTFA